MNSVSTADRFLARLREAEVAYFTLAHQFANRAGNVFNRHSRVDTMLVKKGDVICLEAFERSLNDFPNVLWPAIRARNLAVFNASAVLNTEPELRRNNGL